MRSWLANLKIAIKINLLIILSTLGVAAMIWVGGYEIDMTLTRGRNEQTRRLVEVAVSMTEGLI